MSSPTKIAVHSVPDLKNTTDDALPNYLASLHFRQSHTHTDVRLLLGYTAVSLAAALFYFDYRYGWPATKPYTLPAVLAYFLLNTAFAYWTYFVERGCVYAGQSPDGTKISFASHTSKHVPIYELTVRFTAPAGNKPSSSSSSSSSSSASSSSSKQKPAPHELWQEIKIKAPFTRWFTADGFFVAKPFQQWLATEVRAVGDADPASVVEEIGRGDGGAGASLKREIKMEQLAGLGGATRASGTAGAGAQGAAKSRRKA